MRARILLLPLLTALAACPATTPTTAPETASKAGYPGELLDPASVAQNFSIRQHIEGAYGERKVSFEAVVQKKGETLLVLTLTPYGSRAFLVQQTGQHVEIESFIPRELPFNPRFILLDVQRVFMMGLPDGPHGDGWHEAQLGEELVRERWQDGQLYERRYQRLDHTPSGAVVVNYAGGYTPGERPPTITLRNEWLGYELSLKTSDFQVL